MGQERLTTTVEEAAQALGVSRSAAYRAAAAGQIPIVRIGRRMLVPRAWLTAIGQSTTDTPNAES